MAKGSIPGAIHLDRCSPRIAAHRCIGDRDRIASVANSHLSRLARFR